MSRWQQFLLSLLGFTLIATVVVFAVILQKTHRELEGYAGRERQFEARLERLEADFQRKQMYLNQLEEDPGFLERVVRERLGYSRPEDLLYRFPE